MNNFRQNVIAAFLVTLALAAFAVALFVSMAYGWPWLPEDEMAKRGVPEHVIEKIPAEKAHGVQAVLSLRDIENKEQRKQVMRDMAHFHRVDVATMNPIWAEQEEIDEAEVEAVIEASSDRLSEEVAPRPLILTELDVEVLQLIDVQTIALMLQELDVYTLETIPLALLEVMVHQLTLASLQLIPVEVIELMLAELGLPELELIEIQTLELMLAQLDDVQIRDIFTVRFDEMSASEELFWMLRSRQISISMSPEWARREVRPQAKLDTFIAMDYDEAVARGGKVAVLDGVEHDLLAFQRRVDEDTKLIILNWTDDRLCNYFFKELDLDDYQRIADRIRARRNLMNELFPEIPTAVMIVIGRGNSDHLLLDLLGFEPDVICVNGIASPYAQFDAIARRYQRYGARLFMGTINEVRGFEWGGDVWRDLDSTLRNDDRFVGYTWRCHTTPGGRKRVETRKP